MVLSPRAGVAISGSPIEYRPKTLKARPASMTKMSPSSEGRYSLPSENTGDALKPELAPIDPNEGKPPPLPAPLQGHLSEQGEVQQVVDDVLVPLVTPFRRAERSQRAAAMN